MNKILFPTEWSNESLIAFEFACIYAMEKGSKIVVLNTYKIDDNKSANIEDLNKIAYDQQCENRDQFLERFKVENEDVNLSSLVAEIKIIEGDPSIEIVEATVPMDIELVVIGRDGLKPEKNGVRGTVTSNVIRKAYCPVIVIPPIKRSFSLDKILCAIDFKSDKRLAVSSVMNFACLFEAEVTFLYVCSAKKCTEEELVFRENFKTTQYYLSNLEKWKIDIIEGEDALAEIQEYLDLNKFDLLAVETTAYKTNKGKEYKTIVNNLAVEVDIPLFILHTKK